MEYDSRPAVPLFANRIQLHEIMDQRCWLIQYPVIEFQNMGQRRVGRVTYLSDTRTSLAETFELINANHIKQNRTWLTYLLTYEDTIQVMDDTHRIELILRYS